MFELLKAKMLVWAANQSGVLLLPANVDDREIAESMFLEGAPVSTINPLTLNMWTERLKFKPKYLSGRRPAAEADNGPLRPLKSNKK